MADRFAYEKRYLYGRKAPVPATCNSVEALLRHELPARLAEWLSRKAGVLGCTSSPTILFMCWKEIFSNEDATRFDLVDELYTLPAKLPTSMLNLQDACLKLVVSARARARELQVDQQVERAQQPLSAKTAIPTTKPKPKGTAETDKPVCRFFLKPDGCKNGDNCQHSHPRTNWKCLRCGSESHNLQACARPPTTVFSIQQCEASP